MGESGFCIDDLDVGQGGEGAPDVDDLGGSDRRSEDGAEVGYGVGFPFFVGGGSRHVGGVCYGCGEACAWECVLGVGMLMSYR